MLKRQLHFTDGAGPLCPGAPRRAQRVEFQTLEASGSIIHYGVIRASVEQEQTSRPFTYPSNRMRPLTVRNATVEVLRSCACNETVRRSTTGKQETWHVSPGSTMN